MENAFEVATRPDARSSMAPEDVARYEAEGASLTIDDGVRYALGEVEIEDLLGSPGRPAEPVTGAA